MGNTVTRAMTYSISQNQKNAVAALSFQGEPLSWFRLDDGVMGGQSETTMDKIQYHHKKEEETTDILLQFVGNINTNGGGFTSIRAKVTLPAQATGLKIRYKGDGKTYKVLLSNANRGGPFSKTPSWQADLPTTSKVCEDGSNSDDDWDEVVIKFDTLLPAFGGGPRSQPSEEEKASYKFDPTEMKEIGLMLSLRLSDGSPNPKESFGDGEFPFTLLVHSIDIVVE
ncbi:epimerase dehydratase [Seminavis robusta]|uniref:Epimerase dehydratase n=1 Tax=Seminavis robusta TaxID=568900 RepID=A0A9N8DUE1_9STRA|nr:epimerase dehydratase [Seminavis robusta]|eukprot:Sro287_g108670.1 epimerase dehydratase (226) ;mRNA; f:64743-65420